MKIPNTAIILINDDGTASVWAGDDYQIGLSGNDSYQDTTQPSNVAWVERGARAWSCLSTAEAAFQMAPWPPKVDNVKYSHPTPTLVYRKHTCRCRECGATIPGSESPSQKPAEKTMELTAEEWRQTALSLWREVRRWRDWHDRGAWRDKIQDMRQGSLYSDVLATRADTDKQRLDVTFGIFATKEECGAKPPEKEPQDAESLRWFRLGLNNVCDGIVILPMSGMSSEHRAAYARGYTRTPEPDMTKVRDPLPASSKPEKEPTRVQPPISHDEARTIAQMYIDAAFGNRGKPRPLHSIPANARTDSDIRLMDYIAQQEAKDAPLSKPSPQGEIETRCAHCGLVNGHAIDCAMFDDTDETIRQVFAAIDTIVSHSVAVQDRQRIGYALRDSCARVIRSRSKLPQGEIAEDFLPPGMESAARVTFRTRGQTAATASAELQDRDSAWRTYIRSLSQPQPETAGRESGSPMKESAEDWRSLYVKLIDDLRVITNWLQYERDTTKSRDIAIFSERADVRLQQTMRAAQHAVVRMDTTPDLKPQVQTETGREAP